MYGNSATVHHISSLIVKLLVDRQQELCPFIIIAGPAHIGKSFLVQQLIKECAICDHDYVMVRDCSDDWLALKETNDLAGTYHPIQIEVESKREDIYVSKTDIVHNWGVRELQERLVRSPLEHTKVVLIEAIERATTGAANALLKTFEEPLPYRLIIATTHHLDQVPQTIASRAMIFRMEYVDDGSMKEFVQYYEGGIYNNHPICGLLGGRPGLLDRYHRLGLVDEIVDTWVRLQGLLQQGMLAELYQYCMTIYKAGYWDIMIELIMEYSQWYDVTLELIRRMDSNVVIDNIIFDWCLRVIEGRNNI